MDFNGCSLNDRRFTPTFFAFQCHLLPSSVTGFLQFPPLLLNATFLLNTIASSLVISLLFVISLGFDALQWLARSRTYVYARCDRKSITSDEEPRGVLNDWRGGEGCLVNKNPRDKPNENYYL